MKNVYNRILLLLTILLLGCHKQSDNQSTKVYQVARGDLISKITISGKIIPARAAYITAPYSGHVKQMFVQLGQDIKKNDPLVSITQTLLKVR